MKLEVDDDVLEVATFMQGRIAASRLVAVAEGLAAIAPTLWKKYPAETVQVLRLDTSDPTLPNGQRRRLDANE
ncbi:MAG TPA: hypothetical protein VNZ26_34095 [Vicinamibacterales bacterium]|jgi:hypothetical protein|nr:hypothetical protein [Vicinamibacterales bacterium]